MIPPPASLLAGATAPHGEHERADQGWDAVLRLRYAEHVGLDADALSYGSHARPADTRPAKENR